jgi:adenine deaminase
MDDAGTEHEQGWVRVEDGLVAEVGAGAAPAGAVDLRGALVTPGLVNTHHHLYQTLTRARAQQADLVTWLKTLYPRWARIDDEMEYAAARCGLAELPLPVAGIMSDAPLAEVVERSHAVVAAAEQLGCTIEAPFQLMAFLALSVIPSLKITDRGLVDVDRFELVPLEVA